MRFASLERPAVGPPIMEAFFFPCERYKAHKVENATSHPESADYYQSADISRHG